MKRIDELEGREKGKGEGRMAKGSSSESKMRVVKGGGGVAERGGARSNARDLSIRV